MKKLLVILLLFILAYIQVGHFIHSEVNQLLQRHKMKQYVLSTMPDGAFHSFDLEKIKDHVDWEDDGSEFKLNGRLYDVARIKKVKGRTMIYCINDTEEEKIVHQKQQKVNNSNKNNLKISKGAKFPVCYLECKKIFNWQVPFIEIRPVTSFYCQVECKKFYELISPPPQV